MGTWASHPPLHLPVPVDAQESFAVRLRLTALRDSSSCRALRLVGAVLCRAALRVFGRIRFDGKENLPTDGPFVLVANHASHLDAPCLLAALPLARVNRAFPTAASDYFFAPETRARAAAVTIFLNALPFDRRSRHCGRSLRACASLLGDPSADNVLIVFPEGTRSGDGIVQEFKRGIGELVARRDVPVVPCHIDGAFGAWPRGRRLPRPWRSRLRVTIGRPIRFADRPAGKAAATEIASELRDAVIELCPTCNDQRVFQ
jgi:1-acyl-sn-glycerol-3-phosphate acyltransferase